MLWSPRGDSELKVSVAKTSRVAREGKCVPGPQEEWVERRKHLLWTPEAQQALTCRDCPASHLPEATVTVGERVPGIHH